MSKLPKLSKKAESDLCLACGECCKRYWITVLPEEATRIAALQKKTKREFLEEDCVLHVKLYPKSTPGVLTFPTTFFPKRIYELLKQNMGLVPESFFVVPQVVLMREEKNVFNFTQGRTKNEERIACTFLSAENLCAIYESRPGPCKLFPFIVMPGYKEAYPFCELFAQTEKDLGVESRIYYTKIQSYFKRIDTSSFKFIWRTPPKKGILFLQDKQIGEITLDELYKMIPNRD
jgi:Fe-S-cluster containining protein